jgi:hypothetical protein
MVREQINSSRTAAVDRHYHWVPVGKDTPRGVKLQLINRPAGVATYGNYDPKETFWTHYALMPTFNPDEGAFEEYVIMIRIEGM